MAYTYEDFENELQESGLSGQFSSADLELAKNDPDAGMGILNAKKDYASATSDEERELANSAAESIRGNSGYSGGRDGSGYSRLHDGEDSDSGMSQSEINRLLRERGLTDEVKKIFADNDVHWGVSNGKIWAGSFDTKFMNDWANEYNISTDDWSRAKEKSGSKASWDLELDGRARAESYKRRAPIEEDVDYQSWINYAEKLGNETAAAYFEQLRNRKIEELGLDEEKTYKYQSDYDAFVPEKYLEYLHDSYAREINNTDANMDSGMRQTLGRLENAGLYDEANSLRREWGYQKNYETGEFEQLLSPDWRGRTLEQWYDLNTRSNLDHYYGSDGQYSPNWEFMNDWITYNRLNGTPVVTSDGAEASSWQDTWADMLSSGSFGNAGELLNVTGGDTGSGTSRLDNYEAMTGQSFGSGINRSTGTASSKSGSSGGSKSSSSSGKNGGSGENDEAEDAKKELNTAYHDAKSSVSGTAGQSRLEFNERARAAGLGSGAHSRGLAAIDSAGEKELEKLEKQRIEAINEIHRALGEDEEVYRAAVKDSIISGDAASAQELYDEYQEKKRKTEELKKYLEKLGKDSQITGRRGK